MQILTEKDPQQQFLPQYTSGAYNAFYHYDLSKDDIFKRRNEQPVHPHTAALAEVIRVYMSSLECSEQQQQNIDDLKKGAQVVIGGQQAGLFVSPLYTIHKIISIIILAREQSTALGRPIVPVFWIAGEDHDFSEVNHAFLYEAHDVRLKKIKFATKRQVDRSVSTFTMTDKERLDTVNHFISSLPETTYTSRIKDLLMEAPLHWTEQFKQLIHELFKAEGLLLIDSQYAPLRKLETEALKWMLQHHVEINEAFLAGQNEMYKVTGEKMIETTTNVHLFIDYEEQRQLINYVDGEYVLSKSDIRFNREELETMIEEHPEQFSNNVVTRPLMQELMFNTLAFIGGPAEIKYWGELKQVFELRQQQMPIIIPRMRITYLTKRTKRLLEQYHLNAADVAMNGIGHHKAAFLAAEKNEVLIDQIQALQKTVNESFTAMQQTAENQQTRTLLDANLKHHLMQISYLEKAYDREIKQKNNVALRHFEELSAALHPRHGLQERTWHPFQWINSYGFEMFSEIISQLNYHYDQTFIEIE